MPAVTIDGKAVEVVPGATLMDAARLAGAEIPALCHARGVRPQTSCMLCVVKDTRRGLLVPSCTARAEDGMVIETRCEEVLTARRSVLQMLLSEHAGDCEAPCRHACPAFFDISEMMRRIELGDHEGAAAIARDELVLPATLGYVCSAPCEKTCHRMVKDGALRIRDLHRLVAEESTASQAERAAATGRHVAIVGASAAGLAAAYVLLRLGHACTLFEKTESAGRMIREYAEDALDYSVLDAEVAYIGRLGAQFHFGIDVGIEPTVETLRERYDAVVISCDDLAGDGEGLFYAVEYPMAVNAIAEGKTVADQAHRYLCGMPDHRRVRDFNSKLGPLREDEVEAFLSRLDPEHSTKRTFAGLLLKAALGTTGGARGDGNVDEPHAEASRCMHCECLKPASCQLRRYATEYGADQNAFRFARRGTLAPTLQFGEVVFEPGKCIKCGLCIAVGHDARAAFGMTLEGRGYGAQVKVPFEKDLATALEVNAKRCVEICPTGALAYRRGERQLP